MVMVPDSWPPQEDSRQTTAPVFVLPDVFLFPGQFLPLHVFEPRYRAMIEDSLDGPGRIVVTGTRELDPSPALPIETDSADSPAPQRPLRQLGGLGEIARHEKLPDGRFLIWLGGVARVLVDEQESATDYRIAKCTVLPEIAPAAESADRLRGPLVEAITSRLKDGVELGDGAPIGILSDILSRCIAMPSDLLENLFEETDVERRAELALEAHAHFPPEAPPRDAG